MKKPQARKRWMWLAAATGLTAILVITQILPGNGRSRKTKKM